MTWYKDVRSLNRNRSQLKRAFENDEITLNVPTRMLQKLLICPTEGVRPSLNRHVYVIDIKMNTILR